MPKKPLNRNEDQTTIPQGKMLLDAIDIQKMGFSRRNSYCLLNTKGMPVLKIGGRKYMHRRLFEAVLELAAMRGEDLKISGEECEEENV